MAARRPLVNVSGQMQELPVGDTLTGGSAPAAPNVASGLTATGTTQADALQLTDGYSFLSTTALNTGVKLPTVASTGTFAQVVNHGANELKVYPASGQSIDPLAANLPLVIQPGNSLSLISDSATSWEGIDVNIWDDENNALTIPQHASAPPTPPAGSLSIFAEKMAGRVMPAFKGASGLDSILQPIIGKNKLAWWQPLGSATTSPITTGITTAVVSGTTTTRTFATTNIATRTRRIGYVSAATVGSLAGHYWGVAASQYSTGDGSGLGGFTYIERVVISDAAAVSGARMFIGMSSNVLAPTNVEPNTLTNCMGFAQLSTDATQWYFVYGGSSAQTAIALGTSLGAPTLTDTVWDLSIFAFPNTAGKIGYKITNLASNVSVEGVLTLTPTTQIPPSTQALVPRAWRCNNATALAVGLDICSMYIETDY